MWLDRQEVTPLVMKEIAMTQFELKKNEEKAEKYGWDSRYGKMYQQLVDKKLRLRHMLYHCYITYHDEQAGLLIDSPLFETHWEKEQNKINKFFLNVLISSL